MLDTHQIPYSIIEYESDEENLDALSVADKIGFEPERVFKTLVARSDKNEIVVFVIPGNFELDLKKAASVSGSKKVEMIRVIEIQQLTGYIRGGCSPIGMKKQYRTFIDETAQLFNHISISAGSRGIQVIVSPTDLLSLIEAEYADLI